VGGWGGGSACVCVRVGDGADGRRSFPQEPPAHAHAHSMVLGVCMEEEARLSCSQGGESAPSPCARACAPDAASMQAPARMLRDTHTRMHGYTRAHMHACLAAAAAAAAAAATPPSL